MFKKKNKPEPAQTPEENGGEVQFTKNIKTLWIYTTLFCLFALALIVISSVIQGKMNDDAEYYQGLYDTEKTQNQSTIQNIQTENQSLRAAIESYKAENEALLKEFEEDEKLVTDAAELIENAEYILLAQKEAYTGSYGDARDILEKADPALLTEDMRECYDSLAKMLGM